MNGIFVSREMDMTPIRATASQLRAAQTIVKKDRTAGLVALNNLFRSGTLPEPLPDGRYRGELVALDLAPALTPFFGWLTNLWMPWKGKTFDASRQCGDNIFTRDSYPLARLFNPFYDGFFGDETQTYRGFDFRTYSAPGLFDPDRTVLKIDYDLKENPALTVRRVLDELVQLEQGSYLGKAHVRWWWSPANQWQTVAYFSLLRD